MRVTALVVGVTIAGLITPATGATVSAQTTTDTETKSVVQAQTVNPQPITLLDESKVDSQLVLADWVIASQEENQEQPTEEKPEPKPEVYEAIEGDTLTSIAKAHDVDWLRLWQKNTNLEHPDELQVGDKVTIPLEDEKLKERELPEPPVVEEPREEPEVQASTPSAAVSSAPTRTTTTPRGSSSGNLYTPGYCTWYVKERRPDLPNNLGNAYTWYSRAQAQGLPTGTTPRVGAVGQRNNHVVYVERVNGDGTILISEMNYRQVWDRNTRTVSANEWRYIY